MRPNRILASAFLAGMILGSLTGCGNDNLTQPQKVLTPARVVYVPTFHHSNEWAFVNYGETTAHNVYVRVGECGIHTAGYTRPRDIPPFDRYNLDTIAWFPDPAPDCGGDGEAEIVWD